MMKHFLNIPVLLLLLIGSLSFSYQDKTEIVYESDRLIIKKLSNHIYQHISFLQTDDYGKVGCNGMIVINDAEAYIFDSPTNDSASLELIYFLNDDLGTDIAGIIPTHFHEDCIGGIKAFSDLEIPVYASNRTIDLIKKNNPSFSYSIKGFDDDLELSVGGKKLLLTYHGEGHTSDNIVGYFPKSKALFGGCLVKSVGAGKGYLGDANVNSWSETVKKVKASYPDAKIVIPGHGTSGGTELLDFTITLFENK